MLATLANTLAVSIFYKLVNLIANLLLGEWLIPLKLLNFRWRFTSLISQTDGFAIDARYIENKIAWINEQVFITLQLQDTRLFNDFLYSYTYTFMTGGFGNF